METANPADEGEDVAYFLEIIRYDWVVTKAWNRLHAVDLPESVYPDIRENWGVYQPVRLACGRLAAGVWIPGMFTRMGAQRCTGCCRATGLPSGRGSPKNDRECRRILGLPVKEEEK